MTEPLAAVVGSALDAAYDRHVAECDAVMRRHGATLNERKRALAWIASDWRAWRARTLAVVSEWAATVGSTVH